MDINQSLLILTAVHYKPTLKNPKTTEKIELYRMMTLQH